MRKIIQIAIDSQPTTQDWNAWSVTTALCDDGSVWELQYNPELKQRVWERVPDIPQDNDA